MKKETRKTMRRKVKNRMKRKNSLPNIAVNILGMNTPMMSRCSFKILAWQLINKRKRRTRKTRRIRSISIARRTIHTMATMLLRPQKSLK